jgi:hypothetical protein
MKFAAGSQGGVSIPMVSQEYSMQLPKLLALPIVLLSLTGCVIVSGEHGWNSGDWQDEQRENRRVISTLEIGMERGDVVSRLGTPSFSEAYSREGDEYRVLYFRTQHRHSDGETSRDETTPLVFRNDTLIGWGDDVVASIR